MHASAVAADHSWWSANGSQLVIR